MWSQGVTDPDPSEYQAAGRLSLPLGPMWNIATVSTFHFSSMTLCHYPSCSIPSFTTVTLKMDKFTKLAFKI